MPSVNGAAGIKDLVQRAVARDKRAWDTLVEQYGPLVWRVLCKFSNTLNQAAQEDLFQEIFVTLLDGGLERFRGATEHEFRAYLGIIAANKAKTAIRDRGRHGEVPLASFLSDPDDD